MTSANVLRRIELLEKAIAAQHSPKLVFVWTARLAEKISEALGPNYQCVTIRGITGCADDDEVEATIRSDNPDEAARLDRLLAGIPPE
jgi:hypothetical protein